MRKEDAARRTFKVRAVWSYMREFHPDIFREISDEADKRFPKKAVNKNPTLPMDISFLKLKKG